MPACLPSEWISAAFSGWSGEAEVIQGTRAVPLPVSAPALSTLVAHSPSGAAPFACLEPVSRSVDAHDPGQPGPVRLEPGQTLSATMILS